LYVISFLFQRNEKRKKLSREKRNWPIWPKQPNLFRPFISERMAEIAFALYKRIPKPYSTTSPSPQPPPAARSLSSPLPPQIRRSCNLPPCSDLAAGATSILPHRPSLSFSSPPLPRSHCWQRCRDRNYPLPAAMSAYGGRVGRPSSTSALDLQQ
jgi:hypothetical protein